MVFFVLKNCIYHLFNLNLSEEALMTTAIELNLTEF